IFHDFVEHPVDALSVVEFLGDTSLNSTAAGSTTGAKIVQHNASSTWASTVVMVMRLFVPSGTFGGPVNAN
mgnify:CR=1